jgi:hypothetical protein
MDSDQLFRCEDDDEDDQTFPNYNKSPSQLKRNNHLKVAPEVKISKQEP